AEQETDIDWMLLAAVAYQESHWKADAVSPTGVKGIMMLTNAAAKEVNVMDRTDPIQSVIGGAQYLLNVKGKIPDRIPEPDHTWFALAGYNVGFGHLEDARILTQRANKDPDKWDDVREFLPLLSKKKYFSTVKYGYARGQEPVQYVANIKKYIELLEWEKQIQQIRQARDASIRAIEEEKEKATPSTIIEIKNIPATL
uniref:transglycosylase SLT domain-containing protein n=1 Tax=Neptunomonas sp. TaxID=1971898 RepID=UPI003567924A